MNENPSHSYTEGAEYTPTAFARNPITSEYLLKNDFQKLDDIAYQMIINDGVFNAVVINVEVEPNCLAVSMTIANCDKWTILPIETEFQLGKLINALRGR